MYPREPIVVPNVYKHFLRVISYYRRNCRQGFIGKATSAKRERQIPSDITYMWNLKYDTHGLSMKQKQIHRHREETRSCQGGWGWGRNGLDKDQQWQTIMHKLDKQQGLTVQHRGKYSISYDKKNYEKECMRTFLVLQWLRLCASNAGAWIQSLVRE